MPYNGPQQDVVPGTPPKFENKTPGYRGPLAGHVDDPAASTLGQRMEAAHEATRRHNLGDHQLCNAEGCKVVADLERILAEDAERNGHPRKPAPYRGA